MQFNDSFQLAADFMQYTSHPIFLTGKAGTGKTTFLKYCKENSKKNTAIVAPTGVAAMNAGGTTIHSFFQLPFNPFIPGNRKFNGDESVNDKHSLLSRMKLNGERRAVMRKLELLIIDEISMVRADLLDAIDVVLRHVRNQPFKTFGGVQVLFIGDLFQLSPVAKEEEWKILGEYYASPFFFHSKVIESHPPVPVTLEKIYRQNDPLFVDLLNQVRNNRLDKAGFDILQKRYDPNFVPNQDEGFITLSTHNYKADAINQNALQALPTNEIILDAAIEGEFAEKSYPADAKLILKPGAQVMFIKNDAEKIRRYFNGKIGIVEKITDEKVFVQCTDESIPIEVSKEKWKNIKYKVDKTNNQVEEEEIGSFTQFPLRLAWAITIHKSQGLTFEKAIIDAGDAFAPGQVYVALSRCTSLEGIILKSRITAQSLKTDPRVVEYSNQKNTSDIQWSLLEKAKSQYETEQIKSIYDYSQLLASVNEIQEQVGQESKSFNTNAIHEVKQIVVSIQDMDTVAKKFEKQIDELVREDMRAVDNQALQSRLSAASGHFLPLTEGIRKKLENIRLETDSKIIAQAMNQSLQLLYDQICFKIHLLESLENGFSIQPFLERKKSFQQTKRPGNVYTGVATDAQAETIHQELFLLLKKKRDELCAAANLPVYMVAKTASLEEMVQYLPKDLHALNKISGFGPVKSRQYGEAFLTIIEEFCEAYGLESDTDSKPNKKSTGRKSKSEKPNKTEKVDTKKLSFELFKAGNSIRDIASIRKLTTDTIESHLCHYIENGSIALHELLPEDIIESIRSAIKIHGNNSSKILKDNLPEAISYGEIRMVLARESAND